MHDTARGKKFLRAFLESAIEKTDFDERLANDPIGLVRVYDSARDQEIVGFIAAGLAYGRVSLVRDAIRRALDIIGPNPADTLVRTPPEDWHGRCDLFVYRMTRGSDLADLFAALGTTLREEGSLEALYGAVEGDHLQRSSHLVQTLRDRRVSPEVSRGLRYLLVDPLDGSTAKRLNMFFRWVARGPDEVDLGIWSKLSPADLIMPMDTHTSRIARYIGLTSRAATDLKLAIEVTESLRELCAEDPLRYDFAMAHLGISGQCIHRRSAEHCPNCPLETVCLL